MIAGFALGFVAGGLAGPTLISILGSTEHLLAGGAAAAGLFMFLVSLTRRNFAEELSSSTTRAPTSNDQRCDRCFVIGTSC